MDLLIRLDACAECENGVLAPLLADAAAEIRTLRRDAERYRWLRKSVGNPAYCARSTQFGVQIVHGELLDEAIDAAMNGANV